MNLGDLHKQLQSQDSFDNSIHYNTNALFATVLISS